MSDCLNVLPFEWLWFISSLWYPSKILSESPSSRCFPHNASSRIHVELNLLEITTILLTDDLLRHSLHCNIVFCIIWIIPSLSVNYLSILGSTMMPEPHEHNEAKAWSSGVPTVVCMMLYMSYYVSICSMESQELSADEPTFLSFPVWSVFRETLYC